MNLFDKISNDIKSAMLAREKERLEALRAIKSAFLLAKTEKGASDELSDDRALQIIQKLIKQRKESAEIYSQNNRPELAEKELFEAGVINEYMPAQMSEDEIKTVISEIIKSTGTQSVKEMGKVMGEATKKLAGKADGKKIAELVKNMLPS
jgi:uncharacterized protein YqeY